MCALKQSAMSQDSAHTFLPDLAQVAQDLYPLVKDNLPQAVQTYSRLQEQPKLLLEEKSVVRLLCCVS